MLRDSQYLGAYRGLHLHRAETDDGRYLVVVGDNTRANVGKGGIFLLSDEDAAEVVRQLGEAALMACHCGIPHAYLAGGWLPVSQVAVALSAVRRMVRFLVAAEPDKPLPPVALDLAHARRAVRAEELVRGGAAGDPFDDIAGLARRQPCRLLGEVLAGGGFNHSLPQTYARVRHPVHPLEDRGALLRRNVLFDYDLAHLSGPVDPTYPHLRRVVKMLGTTPDGEAAFLATLLGALCVESFSRDCDRMVLLMDARRQGRGKTHLCAILSILLDDTAATTTLPRSGEAQRDELVAATVNRRAPIIDNIEGRFDWNNEFIAANSAGTGDAREKYGHAQSQRRGLLFIINTNAGAVTFHRDMVARFLRVELLEDTPPPASIGKETPKAYAETHRHALLRECLHLLEATEGEKCARPAALPFSRFRPFEELSAPAVARLLALSPGEVFARLQESRESARIYLRPVLRSFCRESGVVLPNTRAEVELDGGAEALTAEHVGARLAGQILGPDMRWRAC